MARRKKDTDWIVRKFNGSVVIDMPVAATQVRLNAHQAYKLGKALMDTAIECGALIFGGGSSGTPEA